MRGLKFRTHHARWQEMYDLNMKIMLDQTTLKKGAYLLVQVTLGPATNRRPLNPSMEE